MDKREYKELSEQAAAGDTKAFAKLYETIYREMYYTAFYCLADDSDAVELIIATVRDGASAVGKLHSEAAFRAFMMKNLCARIRTKFREYAEEDRPSAPERSSGGYDVKAEFIRLPETDRLIASLYIGGKFLPEEIAGYTGLSSAAVKKSLDRVLSGFELD